MKSAGSPDPMGRATSFPRRQAPVPRILLATLATLAFLVAAPAAFATPPDEEAPLGPLGGRNVYAPHLPWFSFPADSAAALPHAALRTRTAVYYVNEFSTYPFDIENYTLDAEGRLPDTDQADLTAMDYESFIWEAGLDWQALPALRFSADWRLHARFGGFMDGTIEWWHGVLGVSNAGREYFATDRAMWNVSGSGIDDFSGEGTVIASGDLDLRTVWTFLDRPKLTMAAGGAFKIPTGRKTDGFGSGTPDIGVELLLDWRPWTRWILYVNAAGIVPLGSNGRLMGQFIPALEFRAFRDLSLLLQLNIQTSPVAGGDSYFHTLFGETQMFGLPQADLKIGVRGRSGRFGWQFYFEEDPITWEGPDILFYFGVDWLFDASSENS